MVTWIETVRESVNVVRGSGRRMESGKTERREKRSHDWSSSSTSAFFLETQMHQHYSEREESYLLFLKVTRSSFRADILGQNIYADVNEVNNYH